MEVRGWNETNDETSKKLHAMKSCNKRENKRHETTCDHVDVRLTFMIFC